MRKRVAAHARCKDRPYPAALLAVGFLLVTCFVLFKDVWDGAALTTDHVLSFAVLVGTFASGHLLSEQLRQWRVLPSLGLLILFIAGTFYCVTASAGRTAATTGEKAELVHKSNDNRARVEADLTSAKDRLGKALEAEDYECASGKGERCRGRRATREERQTYVNVLEAQLRMMDPARSEYPELRHAAKVFASIVAVDEQTILDTLILWFPFLKAMFAETATLVFGSIAVRRSKAMSGISRPETFAGKPFSETVSWKPTLGHVGTLRLAGSKETHRPMSKDEALADLLTLVSDDAPVVSQELLRKRFGVSSKGTVSKWLAEWERRPHDQPSTCGALQSHLGLDAAL